MNQKAFWMVMIFCAMLGLGLGFGLTGCKEVKTNPSGTSTSQPANNAGTTSQPSSSQPSK